MNDANALTTGKGGPDLQGHLLSAANDLDRLQLLLSDACESLLRGFYGAIDQMRTLLDTPSPTDDEAFERAMQHLHTAVTGLQFQDMASQLISHTHHQLQSCAERLARDPCQCDETSLVQMPPLRPNPVAAALMNAGSIELFD